MSLTLPLSGFLALLLSGCDGCQGPDTDSPTPDDTAGDSQPDSVPVEDTGPPLQDVSARIHDEIGSVILVSWEQTQAGPAHVEYSFEEEDWLSTPSKDREEGDVEQIVLGVPYGMETSYRVVWGEGDNAHVSDTGTIQNDDPPLMLEVPEVLAFVEKPQDRSARYFLTSINEIDAYFDGPWWTTIYDRQGRLVWALETPSGYVTLQPRLSHDGGAILVDHNSYWAQFDDGEASTVRRYALDGTVEHEYAVPGLQHAYTEIDGGIVLWGANTPRETIEQVGTDGVQSSLWSCDEFHASVGLDRNCSSNTLYWHPSSDTLLFSFFNTVTVVEIDRQTGETLRWYGETPGAYSFDPPESAFYWQHGVTYTDDDTLLLSTNDGISETETMVHEYQPHQDTQVLELIWSFGEGEGILSESHSDAQRLPNGNTLHNFGRTPRVREITPEGLVSWELGFGDSHVLGVATPFEDLYDFVP